ncbi:hypothetical protein BEL05_17590 [Shewanella colwelliana]|uniref:Uncharacterized protein n=1 Tax=Shewanella colwelliana TaxID=23 RepID=A0A1E5IYR1_SHECO|nr:hypothetical protein [Shewanella colwelliana]OEG75636.1 hypothetical protein BEL05_17590 [Shewanella colwelliana]
MDEPKLETIRKNLGVEDHIPFFGYLIYRGDSDEFLAKFDISSERVLKGWHKFPDQAKSFKKVLEANRVCQQLELDPGICEIMIGFDLGKQIVVGPLDNDIVSEN